MNIIKFTLFAFLFCANLFAQNNITIRGRVIDSDKNVIPYVNVYVQGSFNGAMTDEEGEFVFITSKHDTINIIATMVGYKKYYESFINVKTDSLELFVTLLQKSIKLDEAIVTGSSFSSEEEKGITVTQMDVYMTPGGAADIYQSLKTMPGMTQVSESAELYVRGGDPIETVTMIDQATIYHPFTLESSYGGLFSNLNTASFKNLYFSSGGFSVKYGNVLSGVLDIETLNEPVSSNVSIGISMAAADVSARIPIKEDKAGFYFNTQHSFTKPLMMLNGLSGRFTSYPSSTNIGSSLIYRYSKTGRVKVFGFYAQDNQGVEVDESNFKGIFSGLSNNQFINIQQSDIIFDNLVTKNSFSYNRFANEWKLGILDLETADVVIKFRNDNDIVLDSFNQLKFGAEIEGRVRKYIGTIPEEDHKLDNKIHSGEVLDESMRMTRIGLYTEITRGNIFGIRKLSAIAGVRLDAVPEYDKLWFDPRVSFGYKLNDKIDIKIGGGLFHQMPDIRLLADYDGNKNLDPMVAAHLLFSFDYKISETESFRVEFYNKDYKNFPLENEKYNYLSNGYGYARGIDLIFKGKINRNLDGWISYGFIDTKRMWMDFDDFTNSGFDITHNFSFVAKYFLTSMWNIGITYKYATGRPYTPIIGSEYNDKFKIYEPIYGYTNSDRYKDYQRLDLRITHLNQLFGKYFTVLYIEALNILDIRNLFGYSYNKDFSEKKDVESYFGQRTIVVGGNITL